MHPLKRFRNQLCFLHPIPSGTEHDSHKYWLKWTPINGEIANNQNDASIVGIIDSH